ncbi:MAG: 4'-phosphopantetheinyl transferase superfamily protein [Desulfobacterales bacterium]|nr:4'-phosphopantetheinyl transferase superfamily protein [Desulfobacterales bacterium]
MTPQDDFETPAGDAAIAIDWQPHPGCGLSTAIDGLTLAFVPIQTFQRHYLPGLSINADRAARPLTIKAEDFSAPLLAPSEIERVNAFKSRKRQTEWMAGRLAAKVLARTRVNDALAYFEVGVAYHPDGAPYLEQSPALSLSISHGHDYAVAGLGHSSRIAIGVDIENKKQPIDIETIMRAAFSDRERRCMDPADQDHFFACWTLKEAYLKYLGRGFRESLKQVEILDDRSIWHHGRPVTGLQVHLLSPFPAYILAIVSGSQPQSTS